jgi:hypothetical protein
MLLSLILWRMPASWWMVGVAPEMGLKGNRADEFALGIIHSADVQGKLLGGRELTGSVWGACPECGSAVPQGAVSNQHSAVGHQRAAVPGVRGKDMTGSKGNSVGILIFTVLVASAVIFPLGVALNVLEWPNETTLTDLLLFAPLCALLLGSICLVVIAPTRGIRRLALSAVFLLACAALFTLGIQPRAEKPHPVPCPRSASVGLSRRLGYVLCWLPGVQPFQRLAKHSMWRSGNAATT